MQSAVLCRWLSVDHAGQPIPIVPILLDDLHDPEEG